jgi:hypothetical protein
MKLTALTFLSTLAVAAGFAPGFVGRQASPLFADLKSGTVKWCVTGVTSCCDGTHFAFDLLLDSPLFPFTDTPPYFVS